MKKGKLLMDILMMKHFVEIKIDKLIDKIGCICYTNKAVTKRRKNFGEVELEKKIKKLKMHIDKKHKALVY